MVLPQEIEWQRCRLAESTLAGIEPILGADRFQQWSMSLKKMLCDYFTADARCGGKLGKSISPILCRVAHGKGFKVRFAYPGCGKSGGVRIAVLAFCEQRLVKLAGAWRRKEEPEDGDFDAAFQRHD